MRVLIVDDEALARALLAEQLAGISGMEVVGQAANGFEAVKLAEELSPDVMLLDIQMPKLSGFEVLELLGSKRPGVIFITAHDDYAIRAFEVHAVDYLLKPVDPSRLRASLERAAARAGSAAAEPAPEQLSRLARPAGRALERVVIRDGARVHVLPVEQIDFIQAHDDYLEFASSDKRLRKQQTLTEIGSQLDGDRFVRIHRSFILNVERLVRIEPYAKDSWLAILKSGDHLPMSRTGYARLKELIG